MEDAVLREDPGGFVQAVRDRASVRQDVSHLDATGGERVGEDGPMAARRIRLGRKMGDSRLRELPMATR